MLEDAKNYILAYYQQIKNGSVNVNKWIEFIYSYLVKGIDSGKFIYDQRKGIRAINFIERYCRHHEGELAPNLIKLELWQKAMIQSIFGIVDENGYRVFREVFIVVGRKNGKSILASAIANYMLFADKEYGARIYFTATKIDQAKICFEGLYQMIQKEPTQEQFAKKRRSDIYVQQTNSTAQPIASNSKKSDGLNISCGICDEVASWEGDKGLKFYEVLKSSFGARKQPLLLSITTAGYVDGGVYDELFARASRMLKGESRESRFLPFIYQIDDVEKWDDINELRKSNPNMGVSVSADFFIEEARIAEQSLPKMAEFKTKYCNIKQNSSQAWLDYEDISKCCKNEIHLEDFKRCYATIGIDLSRTTDLTCVSACIEKDGIVNIFAKFFMPREKVKELSAKDNVPYEIYERKGFLKFSGDNFVDYKDCFNWIVDLLKKYQIYPQVIGYDRYSSQYLIQDLESAKFKVDDVFQGNNLSPVIDELEGLIKDGKINIGNNDLLKIHFLNSALKYDIESNRKRLVKISEREHIDGMASVLDAMCVRQKWWKDYGGYLLNERK